MIDYLGVFGSIHMQKEIEDTKGSSESVNRRARKHNSQEKKDKQRPTKHIHKTKD